MLVMLIWQRVGRCRRGSHRQLVHRKSDKISREKHPWSGLITNFNRGLHAPSIIPGTPCKEPPTSVTHQRRATKDQKGMRAGRGCVVLTQPTSVLRV